MKEITVMVKDPGQPARFLTIRNSLETLQEIVGGYIEIVNLDDKTCIICDEEGRLKGKQHNIAFSRVSFVGTIILAGYKGDELVDFPYSNLGEMTAS